MGDEIERMKKKNLLLSYYSQGSNQNATMGGGDSSSITTTASSSSLNVVNPNLSSPTSKDSSNQIQINSKDPLDINSTSFESDLYLKSLIKEKNLAEIMDCENEIVKETRKLDSEMQTLVSENYNKFISATDTIRKVIIYPFFIS